MKVEKILLPVDGSDGSNIAIEAARKIGEKFGAKIILLNVVDVGNRASMHEYYAYDPTVEDALVKRGQRILEDSKEKLAGVEFEKVNVLGHPGDSIVTYCEENDIDLIVMATRGMTKVRRFFIGSVTNYVMHHTTVPVLAIPVDERE